MRNKNFNGCLKKKTYRRIFGYKADWKEKNEAKYIFGEISKNATYEEKEIGNGKEKKVTWNIKWKNQHKSNKTLQRKRKKQWGNVLFTER